MCGIVGVVGSPAPPSPDPVAWALVALAPRGPDGGGRHDARLGPHAVTLASRRLALVDPPGGRQPFVRPSGAALVMNGEVYNHEALRAELEARGERFRSRCDAEVLAALLDREGPEGLRRVEGSYAFAFLSAPDGPLWFGRDPSGVRPLVYARLPRGLVLASTLDGVLATGLVPPEPDVGAIADLLRDGVVGGERTAIRGVRRVAPGEVMRVGADLEPRRHLWVPAPYLADREPGTDLVAPGAGAEDESPTSVLDALRAAVADRLRLDRPIGTFLSGGIDSALVTALAREVRRIPSYTLTFPGHGDWDEGRRAARTATRLDVPHVEVPCPADPSSWVIGTAAAFDEPFGDASAVPTWGLAKAAGSSVRAVMTGTGGDEVFGGYRRYWLLGAGPWLRHVPVALREPVASAISRATPRGARLLRAAGDPQGLYRGLMRLQPLSEARALAGPLVRPLPEPEPAEGPESAAEAMADDRRRYLPEDLLVKEDRALMAHGVEGRHPFLDRRVFAAASRVELRGAVGRGRQKQVLRAYVREVIDPDLARAGKRGFAFPVDALYASSLAGFAEDVVASKRARERGFVDPLAVRRILKDHAGGRRAHGAVIHALVMLELWARRVLDRSPS
jgi:asparagine synthase (glutamine-hydrolysing)